MKYFILLIIVISCGARGNFRDMNECVWNDPNKDCFRPYRLIK